MTYAGGCHYYSVSKLSYSGIHFQMLMSQELRNLNRNSSWRNQVACWEEVLGYFSVGIGLVAERGHVVENMF